jgi:hypothetical protein
MTTKQDNLENKMQRKIIALVFLSIIATLLVVSHNAPLNTAYAQEPSQDFTVRATSIYQNSKLVISQWDLEYSFQSLEDLKAETGDGLAASGKYGDTVSAVTLRSEELPYFGHSGLNCVF